MSRYTGPSWKLSRRLGISLSGTGKEIEKRPYAPGQHGPNQRKKLSEYGLQLQEKQKPVVPILIRILFSCIFAYAAVRLRNTPSIRICLVILNTIEE